MKFRRKSGASTPEVAEVGDPVDAAPAIGPFDADQLPEDWPGTGRDTADLGSLLIAPAAGREVRMQVEESTGRVQAVLVTGDDGMVELRAFAAPRNGDLWGEIRPQLAADMSRRGGVATEQEGEFGPELACQLTVQQPDGTNAIQPSRIIGVNGDRWMLRATLMGRPAMEEKIPQAWIDTISNIAVRRGIGAMPVGEPLPIVLPERARRAPSSE